MCFLSAHYLHISLSRNTFVKTHRPGIQYVDVRFADVIVVDDVMFRHRNCLRPGGVHRDPGRGQDVCDGEPGDEMWRGRLFSFCHYVIYDVIWWPHHAINDVIWSTRRQKRSLIEYGHSLYFTEVCMRWKRANVNEYIYTLSNSLPLMWYSGLHNKRTVFIFFYIFMRAI